MSQLMTVSGTDLRYLLTAYLFDHGPATVEELVEALAYHGFLLVGRPSKAVSDALRWEVSRGRAVRLGRGYYRPGSMSRALHYRIVKRVRALHDEVTARQAAASASLTA